MLGQSAPVPILTVQVEQDIDALQCRFKLPHHFKTQCDSRLPHYSKIMACWQQQLVGTNSLAQSSTV